MERAGFLRFAGARVRGPRLCYRKPTMKRCILLVSVVLLLASVAAATFREPQGWQKARFGMAVEEFRKTYPKARLLDPAPAGQPTPTLLRYELREQKVGPLRDCTLEFHFSGQPPALFRIESRCPQAPEEIARYLEATYGAPTRVSGSALFWTGKAVEINFVPRGKSFSLNDVARSRSFIASLMQALGQVPLAPTPPATPPPAQ